jgi:Glycosyl hydrolase family 67 C-terminus
MKSELLATARVATAPQFNRRSFLISATATAGALSSGLDLLAQSSPKYSGILIPAGAHPAVRSAAEMLAPKLGLQADAIKTFSGAARPRKNFIVLALKDTRGVSAALAGPIERDGYAVMAENGGLLVCGARPRSLLNSAGETHHWIDRTDGTWTRNPEFAMRFATHHGDHSVAEQVAILGANAFIAQLHSSVSLKNEMPEVYAKLDAATQQRLAAGEADDVTRNAALVKEFHDADVEVFADLPYGNNFSRWSDELYKAFLAVYPSAKGVPEEHSWEKAALCPSDPATWKLFEAYVRECARQSQADGIACTFWDQFGIFCHDERCQKNGLDHFKNELYAAITHYYAALQPMGKKLHLRTWSSGCPHWLGNEYVHAPGYSNFSESHYELWSRVINETPKQILIQTKVYHSDCEPDPRFSMLLGHCKPHPEIVEFQMVGQTIGRHYFPAATVAYTAWTMKKALELVGADGGAEITPGGTNQSNYDMYADILNSVDIYAWRELTWNIDAKPEEIVNAWAAQIYSPQAAPHMAKVMLLSEEAANRTWSPLGHGSSTNSDFAGDIERRETLLRYTNRYYLPEYARFLEPNESNIDLIAAEKKKCLAGIDAMFAEFEAAKPILTAAQADEIATRLDWFREFAVCNVALDESLWRFRYLRAQAAMLTTDPDQLKPLAEAFDTVAVHAPKLFHYDPAQKFECYSVPLGQLRTKPNLGSPVRLMHEIYTRSLAFMEASVGPDYLPKEWIRAEVQMNVPTTPWPGA